MKIGIFGGSFNPPHYMHKNIALKLIQYGYVDKIIYVPTGDKYNKKELISFNHRLNMLNLMIENNNNLSVSPIGNNDKYQYTYQVLDYYRKIYKDDELYFICGTDNLKDFSTWKNYEYVLKNYKLLVVNRNNYDTNKILSEYERYIDNIIIIFNIDKEMLSSTYIRKNIKSIKVDKYIDKRVLEYIKENKLYSS